MRYDRGYVPRFFYPALRYNEAMFTLSIAKRLFAAVAVIAALGYVAMTHLIAADVYAKDRAEEDKTDDSEE